MNRLVRIKSTGEICDYVGKDSGGDYDQILVTNSKSEWINPKEWENSDPIWFLEDKDQEINMDKLYEWVGIGECEILPDSKLLRVMYGEKSETN